MSKLKAKAKAKTPTTPKLVDSVKAFALLQQKTFGHDRSKTIGASEVGRCIRAVVADKSQAWQPDPSYENTNGFAVRGNVMEDAWTAPFFEHHVRACGAELLYSGQSSQVTLTASKSPLSATPDGLVVGAPKTFLAEWGIKDIGAPAAVLEFKSLDDRFDKRKLPKPEHYIQTMAQLGMIRLATKHKPQYGAVIYTDASDYFDMSVHPVKFEPEEFQGVLRRAKTMLSGKDPNQFPPEGKMAGGRECRTCKYAQQCLGFLPWLQKGESKIKDPAAVKQITRLAKLKVGLEDGIETQKKALANTEAELFAALAKHKTRYAPLKGLTVRAKETMSQNRYDQAAMRARLEALGEDVSKFIKPTKPGASIEVEFA